MDLDKNKLYIVMMKGGDIISKSITCFEVCKKHQPHNIYSHVGLLFFKKEVDNFVVLESTLSGALNDNIYDIYHKTKFGVQLRFWNEIKNKYIKEDKLLVIAEILCPLTFNFKEIINRYIGHKYDLINVLMLPTHIEYDNNKYFCSELVYDVLNEIECLTIKINSKKITPSKLIDLLIENNIIKDFIYIS